MYVTYRSLFHETTKKIIYICFAFQEVFCNSVRFLFSFMSSYFKSGLQSTWTATLRKLELLCNIKISIKTYISKKINDYTNMEYVNGVLSSHKSLSDQMKLHLQETAQIVKLERIQCEKR